MRLFAHCVHKHLKHLKLPAIDVARLRILGAHAGGFCFRPHMFWVCFPACFTPNSFHTTTFRDRILILAKYKFIISSTGLAVYHDVQHLSKMLLLNHAPICRSSHYLEMFLNRVFIFANCLFWHANNSKHTLKVFNHDICCTSHDRR